jgi:hypothetical protein
VDVLAIYRLSPCELGLAAGAVCGIGSGVIPIEIEVLGTNYTRPMFGMVLLNGTVDEGTFPRVRAEGEAGDVCADAGNVEAVDKALERLVTATQKVLMVYNKDLKWQK